MKTVRNNKKRICFVIACVCLLLSMMLATVSVAAAETEAAAGGEANVQVVVLRENVKAGSKLTAENFEVKTFKNVNIPENTMSDAKELVGRYAKTNLYAGEYVYKEQTSKDEPVQLNSKLLLQPITKVGAQLINVTEYFPANVGEDVGALIQEMIDLNPMATLYFPDGEYLVAQPILTHSNGDKATAFVLADGAVIKADKANWKATKFSNVTVTYSNGNGVSGDTTVSSVIALGGKLNAQVNNSRLNGSYYYVKGGTIDGAGVADGISCEWGRESLIRNVKIQNFKSYGISIPRGANGNSSDMDIEDCVINGGGQMSTTGIKVLAFDNTISGCRIYDCQTGVYNTGGGNIYRDMRVEFTNKSSYPLSKVPSNMVGFDDEKTDNFYLHCQTVNYATGFKLGNGAKSVVDSCKAIWTAKIGSNNVAFTSRGSLNTTLSNCVAVFFSADTNNAFVKGTFNGKAETPMLKESLLDDTGFKSKLRGSIIPIG